jgi:hypothetical protein
MCAGCREMMPKRELLTRCQIAEGVISIQTISAGKIPGEEFTSAFRPFVLRKPKRQRH